jgi:hypothetical protein
MHVSSSSLSYSVPRSFLNRALSYDKHVIMPFQVHYIPGSSLGSRGLQVMPKEMSEDRGAILGDCEETGNIKSVVINRL